MNKLDFPVIVQRFSNSLIEPSGRTLKHQWLCLNDLNTLGELRRHVAFYVKRHNNHLSHSALQGQTPDEMYFGTGADIPQRARIGLRRSMSITPEGKPGKLCTKYDELVSLSR